MWGGTPSSRNILTDGIHTKSAAEIFDYQPDWSIPSAEDQEVIASWAEGTIDLNDLSYVQQTVAVSR